MRLCPKFQKDQGGHFTRADVLLYSGQKTQVFTSLYKFLFPCSPSVRTLFYVFWDQRGSLIPVFHVISLM